MSNRRHHPTWRAIVIAIWLGIYCTAWGETPVALPTTQSPEQVITLPAGSWPWVGAPEDGRTFLAVRGVAQVNVWAFLGYFWPEAMGAAGIAIALLALRTWRRTPPTNTNDRRRIMQTLLLLTALTYPLVRAAGPNRMLKLPKAWHGNSTGLANWMERHPAWEVASLRTLRAELVEVDTMSGKTLRQFAGVNMIEPPCTMSDDRSSVFACFGDKLGRWDVKTGELAQTYTPDPAIHSSGFSMTGPLLGFGRVFAFTQRPISWDEKSGQELPITWPSSGGIVTEGVLVPKSHHRIALLVDQTTLAICRFDRPGPTAVASGEGPSLMHEVSATQPRGKVLTDVAEAAAETAARDPDRTCFVTVDGQYIHGQARFSENGVILYVPTIDESGCCHLDAMRWRISEPEEQLGPVSPGTAAMTLSPNLRFMACVRRGPQGQSRGCEIWNCQMQCLAARLDDSLLKGPAMVHYSANGRKLFIVGNLARQPERMGMLVYNMADGEAKPGT